MRPTAKFPTSVWTGDTENPDRNAFINYVQPNARDYEELATEVIALEEYLLSPTNCGAVTANVSTAVESRAAINKTVLTLNFSVAITDNTTAGAHGKQKIYDFPEGAITVLSCVPNLTLTASGNLAADSTVNAGIGTANITPDNETLTGTEQNLCSVGAVTLSGNVGTYGTILSSPITVDGTATAVDAILNLAVDATGASGAGAIAVTGTVTMYWIDGGDN